jgi:hypothetical protein
MNRELCDRVLDISLATGLIAGILLMALHWG